MTTQTASPRTEPLRRASGAALDVLLTDAALGSPAVRLLREPAGMARTAATLTLRSRRFARRGGRLAGDLARVARGTADITPAKGDRRFADPAWQRSWFFRRLAQSYLAVGAAVDGAIDDAQLDWRAETTARFVAANVHDLLAPTNFPLTNPSVLKETLDQGGGNLVKGLRRAGRDLAARRLPAMVDTSRFEVGGNLALTPGAVVLRTEVFELLEYAPTTPSVHEIPLLIVPPTINKFYALDLAPGRSLVEHLVAQGQRVFMISWRNPGQEHGHWDLDTYADAVLDAREAVAAIARRTAINLMAACSGGIITAGTLGHLAAAGRLGDEVNSLTLLVCALDAERAGTTSALARREVAAAAVAESARRGYVDGGQLANVFAWLRPNDLVWGYVVNNYLMGKKPPAFDILYWNQDTVRLTAGLHRDFVRLALDNTLTEAGGTTVLGSPVDLGSVDIPVYVVAGLNDHIVPWDNAYRGARLFGGDVRFVLSTSGHIQALINPPGPDSRSSYRAGDDVALDEDAFLREVPTVSGSWWSDFDRWLGARAGERRPARKRLGNTTFKPAAKAPGSYVHAA